MTPVPEWAIPYKNAYMDTYGQTPDRWHMIQILRLQELDASHNSECFEAWKRYLGLTPLEYFGVRRFMSTYNLWDSPMVTKDAAIKRAWNAGLRTLDDKAIPARGFESERDFKRWLDIQLAKQDEGS